MVEAVQTEAGIETRALDEADRVDSWRLRCLIAAGYSVTTACVLATDLTIDLHQAVDLVKVAGCPPETAFQILYG
jgi:hypothetical protein